MLEVRGNEKNKRRRRFKMKRKWNDVIYKNRDETKYVHRVQGYISELIDILHDDPHLVCV